MSIPFAYAAFRLLAAFLLAPAPALAQADYTREQRLADEITPGIVVGDPVWIEPRSGRKFLGQAIPRCETEAVRAVSGGQKGH